MIVRCVVDRVDIDFSLCCRADRRIVLQVI